MCLLCIAPIRMQHVRSLAGPCRPHVGMCKRTRAQINGHHISEQEVRAGSTPGSYPHQDSQTQSPALILSLAISPTFVMKHRCRWRTAAWRHFNYSNNHLRNMLISVKVLHNFMSFANKTKGVFLQRARLNQA